MYGGFVANAGSTEIFLSHITLVAIGRRTWKAPELPIDNSIAPGKSLRFSAPKQDTIDNGFWVKGISRTNWDSFVDTAMGDQACFRVVLFATNDPLFRELGESLGSSLNILPAKGYLDFQAIGAKEAKRLSISAGGTIFVRNSPTCSAKLPRGGHSGNEQFRDRHRGVG
jgi:hypothetical protein